VQPVKSRGVTVPVVVAISAGAVLWFAASVLTGRREPWDATAYWTLVYPAGIVVAALLGYFFPKRAWRWPALLFASQFLAMCVRNGELGNLWPLGLVMFAILALPAVAAARIAARFGSRARLDDV
jgi:hypothetical protein